MSLRLGLCPISEVLAVVVGQVVRRNDAFRVRAHAELLPEPDAPVDLHQRERLPDAGHRLAGDAAGVHIQRAAVGHAAQRVDDQVALVLHRDVLEIQLGIQRRGLFPPDVEAVKEADVREGPLQLGDPVEGEAAQPLTPAEIHVAQVRHLAQQRDRLPHVRPAEAAQVDIDLIALIDLPVGKAQLGRRRRGLRRRIRRGRGFLFGLGRRLRPGRPAAACRQQAAEQGQKQNDSSFHTHHR